MVLSEFEIKEIIKTPRYKWFVDAAKKVQIEHDRHVSGHKFKDLIKPLIGFEKEDQKKVKEQLAQPATTGITSGIIKDLSKWESASDTYKSYVFKNKETSKDFVKDILSNIWKGESMSYFVSFFLKNALWNKFNDFLIVNRSHTEIKDINGTKIKVEVRDGIEQTYIEGHELTPYIAHISVNSCHDFLIYGNKVEYLVYLFKEDDKYKYYKVLDDRGVYTVINDGSDNKDAIKIIKFVENELSELPVLRLSSLLSIIYPNTSTSLLESTISKLNAYVNDYAIYRVSKIMHAFPQRYSAGAKCMYEDSSLESSTCEGSGKIDVTIDNERKTITCPKCEGTGWNTVKDASQDFIVPFFLEGEQRPYSTNPVGYATIDIATLQHQTDELVANEISIKENILSNNQQLQETTAQTATEIIENKEPIVLLNMFFAKLIAFTEKKLTDWIGQLYKPEQYEHSVINYGLNYANKNKDQITEEIAIGKDAGLSISEITQLHNNRIKSANSKDIESMLMQKVLFDLEPFNTMTIQEVETSTVILTIDKMEKFYFNEYVEILKEENRINIEQIKDKSNYNTILLELKSRIKELNKLKYDSPENKYTDEKENKQSV